MNKTLRRPAVAVALLAAACCILTLVPIAGASAAGVARRGTPATVSPARGQIASQTGGDWCGADQGNEGWALVTGWATSTGGSGPLGNCVQQVAGAANTVYCGPVLSPNPSYCNARPAGGLDHMWVSYIDNDSIDQVWIHQNVKDVGPGAGSGNWAYCIDPHTVVSLTIAYLNSAVNGSNQLVDTPGNIDITNKPAECTSDNIADAYDTVHGFVDQTPAVCGADTGQYNQYEFVVGGSYPVAYEDISTEAVEGLCVPYTSGSDDICSADYSSYPVKCSSYPLNTTFPCEPTLPYTICGSGTAPYPFQVPDWIDNFNGSRLWRYYVPGQGSRVCYDPNEVYDTRNGTPTLELTQSTSSAACSA